MTNPDFQFLAGRWTSRQRRLVKVLADNDEWYEFDATSQCQMLLDGNCTFDVIRAPERDLEGITLRLYSPQEKVWRIWWATAKSGGHLDVPVVGRFDGDVGIFECDDVWEGKSIRVRYRWTKTDPDHPRYEQSFSPDGGRTWETNWIGDFTRA
jgi:hypothetical protein